MSDDPSSRNGNRTRLVLGIFLVALGAVLLAANLGYELPYGWWRFYPFILIAFGALGVVMPSRHLDRSGGVWLLAAGLYCLEGVFDFIDLGWSGAWPIFVIAAGVTFMLHRHAHDEAHRPVSSEEPR